jgi:hypothetical protein
MERDSVSRTVTRVWAGTREIVVRFQAKAKPTALCQEHDWPSRGLSWFSLALLTRLCYDSFIPNIFNSPSVLPSTLRNSTYVLASP